MKEIQPGIDLEERELVNYLYASAKFPIEELFIYKNQQDYDREYTISGIIDKYIYDTEITSLRTGVKNDTIYSYDIQSFNTSYFDRLIKILYDDITNYTRIRYVQDFDIFGYLIDSEYTILKYTMLLYLIGEISTSLDYECKYLEETNVKDVIRLSLESVYFESRFEELLNGEFNNLDLDVDEDEIRKMLSVIIDRNLSTIQDLLNKAVANNLGILNYIMSLKIVGSSTVILPENYTNDMLRLIIVYTKD